VEQSVNINLNVNLETLPECPCNEGSLLPVMDTTKEGIVYLKGWFCPKCNTSWLFRAGNLYVEDVSPKEEARR
jgi:hypothetical protein